MMYEIEHRAVLTEEEHAWLSERLSGEATVLGEDNKEVAYYIFPDKLLKVVHNVSKGTGKLSLKLNHLGNGSSFQEFEIPFPAESYADMQRICDETTSPAQVITGTQKRTNYSYEDVEIALKWSEDWGYHVELEMMVADLAQKHTADSHIMAVAEKFSIKLMTEDEVAAFTAKVRASKS